MVDVVVVIPVVVVFSMEVENHSARVVRVVMGAVVRVVVGTSEVVGTVVGASVEGAAVCVVGITTGRFSCAICRAAIHPLPTTPHNTNTAAANDSHRKGE